jgi:hypothetical protein
MKKHAKPIIITEERLKELEAKYKLDMEKLTSIGVV